MNSLGSSEEVRPPQTQTDTSQPTVGIDQIKARLEKEKNLGKEEALAELSATFTELKSLDPKMETTSQLWISILGRYGMQLYPQFERALPYLLASVQLQLQNHGFADPETFDDFSSLKDFETRAPSFDKLIQFIIGCDESQYVQLTKRLTEEEKFQFAQTLSTLEGIYSNLEHGYLNMEKGPFLEFQTRLVSGIHQMYLSMEQTAAVRKELGELHYHKFPGLFLEQCEFRNDGKVNQEELSESFRMLDKALEYNSSDSMKARIANLKCCRVFEYLQDLQLAKQYALESLEQWQKVLRDPHSLTAAEQEEYGNLYANVNNNTLALLIKTGSQDAEEMETFAKVSRECYMKAKEKHPYSIILAFNLARLAEIRGNKGQALVYLQEIEEISAHYQKWPETKKYLEKAAELKQKLV